MPRYDDGKWHASTLGHFIGLLVDAGQDPAVTFRVVSKGPKDDQGRFIQHIEALMIPDDHVLDTIASTGADVHKTLKALIEAKAVK